MHKSINNYANNAFKWKHYAGEIILWLVTWYCRYALSYQDLKEMACERGPYIERSTIMRWVHEYAPQFENKIKPHLKVTHSSIHIDETYIKIKGKWHYLYRAIDKYGQTIDWFLSANRNKIAAKKFFKKIVNNRYVSTISVIHTDKNPAFPPAHKEMIDEDALPTRTKLRRIKYLNNIIENDHKHVKRISRYRQWYQSIDTASKTIGGMEAMRMVQKGQVKHLAKGDTCARSKFIKKLFGLAA